MGKLIAVFAAGLLVAGGGSYALYQYADTPDDLSTCPIARGSCCGGPSVSDVAPTDPNSPAVALAGPAALFATVPVKAESGSCCAKKAAVFNCCEDVVYEPGFDAVVGSAGALARK